MSVEYPETRRDDTVDRHLRVIPQGSDAIAEVRPQRQRLKMTFGNDALLVDPPADITRLEVFHPAVGVGDRAAVIVVAAVNLNEWLGTTRSSKSAVHASIAG
jgi:hypothetical protein